MTAADQIRAGISALIAAGFLAQFGDPLLMLAGFK